MRDRVILSGISAATLVGVHEHERTAPRPILVDLELSVDLADAARSDDLEDTVDYARLTDRVRTLCGESRSLLVEALAGAIAEVCLAEPRVAAVTVTVHKPGAVDRVADVAVRIGREREVISRNERT